MRRRLIFVLDDDDLVRESLRQQLHYHGFDVVVAAAVEPAREVIRSQGHAIDAAVLDMRLLDPAYPKVTGADIGLELRSSQASHPPEVMIYSAFPDVDYYRLAMRLGTSMFLEKGSSAKGKSGYRDVIRHVRALVLRRALSVRDPAVLDTIQRFAAGSHERMGWILRFCRELLGPELEQNLGAPFTLLLTRLSQGEGESTSPVAGTIDLPGDALPIYQGLQSAVFAPHRTGGFVTVAPEPLREKLKEAGYSDGEQILERLNGARFVPLVETRETRLSIGIAQEDPSRNKLAEDAEALARVISQYVRDSVVDQLFALTEKWSASQFESRGMLRATYQFCLNIGQEQIAILDEAARRREVPGDPESHHFRKLKELGESLRDSGELMESALEGSAPSRREIDGGPFIQQVWRRLARQYLPEPVPDLPFRRSCTVYANPSDLHRVILQVLRWLLQRTIDRPDGGRPIVRVELAETTEGSRVVFEDFSRRIDKALRGRLFDPFAFGEETGGGSQGSRFGLYVARVLVENRIGGTMEDLTDELEGELGHRLVITFPLARGTESGA